MSIENLFNSINPKTKDRMYTIILTAFTITLFFNILGLGSVRDTWLLSYEKSIEAQMELHQTEIEIARTTALNDLQAAEDMKILMKEQNSIISKILQEIGSVSQRVAVNSENIKLNAGNISKLDAQIKYLDHHEEFYKDGK